MNLTQTILRYVQEHRDKNDNKKTDVVIDKNYGRDLLARFLNKGRPQKKAVLCWRDDLPKELVEVIEKAIDKGLYKETDNKLIWQYKGYDLVELACQIRQRYKTPNSVIFERSYHIRSGEMKLYANGYDLQIKSKRDKADRNVKEFIVKHINRKYNG